MAEDEIDYDSGAEEALDSNTSEGGSEEPEKPDEKTEKPTETPDPEEEGGRPKDFDVEEEIRRKAKEVSTLEMDVKDKVSVITETLIEDLDAETAEERRNVKAQVDEVVRGSFDGLNEGFEEARENANRTARLFDAENTERARWEVADLEAYEEGENSHDGREVVYRLGDLQFEEEGFMDSLWEDRETYEARGETFNLFTDTTLEKFSRLAEKGYSGRAGVEELDHTIEMYDVGNELQRNLSDSDISSYSEIDSLADLVGRTGILYDAASETKQYAQDKMDDETEKKLEAGERKFKAEKGTEEFTKAKREETKHKDDEENYRSDRELLGGEMSSLVTETAESVENFYDGELMFSDRLNHLSTEVEEFLGDDGLLDNIYTEFQKTVNDAFDDTNNTGYVEDDPESNLDLLYGALDNMKNRFGGPLAENEEGLLDNLWDAADSMLSVRSEFESHEDFYDEVKSESEVETYMEELDTVTDKFFEVDGDTITGYSDEVEELEEIVDTYEEGRDSYGDKDLWDDWKEEGSLARPSFFRDSDSIEALTG